MATAYDENLGALVFRVRNLIRGDTGDEDRILLAIHDAITHLQNTEHLWWMDVAGTLTLQDGIDKYPLESFGVDGAKLRYIEDDLWLDIDGNENNRHRVVRRTPDFLEDKREFQRYSNWPEYWAIAGDELHLWPIPDGSHVINFRGVGKWLPPPIALDATTGDVDTWDAAHTSPWFEHGKGFEIVMYYARVLLAEGELADDSESRRAEAQFLQTISSQRAATEELQLPHRSDPWPAVMD